MVSPVYINSFFRQGWAFFGPNPIINYPFGEFKCIYEDRVEDWKNISKELTNSRRPFSTILISNDSDYIVDSWLEKAMFSISQDEYRLCNIGGCEEVQNKIKQNSSFQNLSRLTNDLCNLSLRKGLVGSKIRVVIQNINYFSERVKNKNGSIDDILEFPISEI